MNQQEREEFLTDKNEWVAIFNALNIPQSADYEYPPAGAERILCICRGGNCRSVAVSMLLKYKYNRDVLCGSIEKNSPFTLRMMANWADKIYVFEQEHYGHVLGVIGAYAGRNMILLDLTGAARLRARPFEIDFLREIDKKLQELGYGSELTSSRR